MSPSSTTRQAGESTSRVVTRTSFARSFSASFSRSSTGLKAVGGFFGLLLLGLVLQLAQVDRALGHALQRLAVELVQVAQHPLVDAVDQQQHLDALLAEDLELRAALRGGQRVGGDVVDRLLAFLHAGHVVGQRHAFVGVRRGKAQQLGQALLVGVVLADAFLQHRAEVLPERRVLGRLGRVFAVGQAFEHATARAWSSLRGSPSRRGFPAAARGSRSAAGRRCRSRP